MTELYSEEPLPVSRDGVGIGHARDHDGVLQTRRHVYQFLIYYRRHGAPNFWK